jgi:CheY-like chemotaxis protein
VRRQADRYAVDLPVDLFASGQRQHAALQDLSRSGMFLQMAQPLPVGTLVHVAMAPDGDPLVTAARVTHSLDEADARALGRFPGVGVAFRAPLERADELFARAVERLLARRARATPPDRVHVVVADPEPRLLERLSTALGDAGFSVATATNGMEAIGACLRRTPDVVLLERTMPVVDGFQVIDQLAQQAELAAVPVIVTSSEPSDLGPAFDRGAADFIPKPFTALEMIVRARRAANRNATRVALRGSLAEIDLPALLTMLEQQRKTGRLELRELGGWIDLVDGYVAAVGRANRDGDPLAILMSMLDDAHGAFELITGGAPRTDAPLGVPIIHLLLEHARRRDESGRGLDAAS